MEAGFKVDLFTLAGLDKTYRETLIALRQYLQGKLGAQFRVNSNKELAELLFHKFSLPPLLRTPGGSNSISITVLERLGESYADTRPLLSTIVKFKRLHPISKSIKTIFKKLDSKERVHPEFNQTSCPTGRIYSYIQNLPKEVRRVLIPDEKENAFIELDWSQQELRILAALSQEPVFLDCFVRNEDLHRRVISEMFHKPISEVTNEERKTGKTINYALIYGQEAPGLAWNLNIPLKKAQELIDQYFSSLPMIQKFKDESREKFLNTGYAETALGRKTKLDLIGPKKERELRRGFNHIMQGTAADILRITLVRLNEALIGTQAKLKFCAHDSIYLEANKEDSGDIAELARSIMEIDFMGVHLPVTMKTHHDFSMGRAEPSDKSQGEIEHEEPWS
jgi:DNA polymerase-1